MNSRTLLSSSLGTAAISAAVAAIVAACGGHSVTNTAECAAGTSPYNGVCVIPEAGGGGDAYLAPDSVEADSGADAPSDVGADAATKTDALMGDDAPSNDATAAIDAPDTSSPSDPCPSNSNDTTVLINCDPHCGDAGPTACLPATCGHGPITLPYPSGLLPQSFVIRTPEAPGTDPNCALDCPGSGYAYGIGIELPGTGVQGGGFQLTVEPPWMIVGFGKPYCDYQVVDDAEAPGAVASHCWWADTVGGYQLFVVTTDPNAPARNIRITSYLSATECPEGGP